MLKRLIAIVLITTAILLCSCSGKTQENINSDQSHSDEKESSSTISNKSQSLDNQDSSSIYGESSEGIGSGPSLYSSRFPEHGIPAQFSDLVDQIEFKDWMLKTRPDSIEMFVKKFVISKEIFIKANNSVPGLEPFTDEQIDIIYSFTQNMSILAVISNIRLLGL